jgi:hypothetical protein
MHIHSGYFNVDNNPYARTKVIALNQQQPNFQSNALQDPAIYPILIAGAVTIATPILIGLGLLTESKPSDKTIQK